MKRFKRILIILLAGVMLLPACDTQDLKDMNVNPKTSDEISDNYLFTFAQVTTGGRQYTAKRNNLFLCSTYVQQLASLTTGDYGTGDKYLYDNTNCSASFDYIYPEAIKNLTQVMYNMKDDADAVNDLAMARIWKTVLFHEMTDLYGDVPYSEAGVGYLGHIYMPKYDKQEDIYADMLNELDEACKAFDASKSTWGSADIVYNSDLTKWKKFGYSMMLRLGMRMSEVDPTSAASWVQKAVAGGVMTSNDDNAAIPRSESGSSEYNQNPNSHVFHETDWSVRISKTLIDFLKNTNDPRLDVMFVKGDSNTVQYGLPNGYDNTTIKAYEGIPSDQSVDLDIYSFVNPDLVDLSAPQIIMSYSEVELLLAEAAERGWGGVTDAQSHYNKGVRAAMEVLSSMYGSSLDISSAAIDAYLLANPYSSTTGFRQIGEQYWLATWMNFYESYANWRRTGYPVLTPVNYPGNESNGQIPRRLRYPSSEYSVNATNVAAAIASQGADDFTTHVWWDAGKK